jgi:hypothetical protein
MVPPMVEGYQNRTGLGRELMRLEGPAQSLNLAAGRMSLKSHQTAKPESFRWLAQMRDALRDKFIAEIAELPCLPTTTCCPSATP